MKKILGSLALFAVLNAQATDFLGINLETSTPDSLDNILINSGGKIVKDKSDKTTHIFEFNNSKIPNAMNAVTYWNDNNEWIGLRIGFKYDSGDFEALSLRKELTKKFGYPPKIDSFIKFDSIRNQFLLDHFYDTAIWKLDNTTLEFHGEVKMNQGIKTSNNAFAPSEAYYIIFREENKTQQLKNNIKSQINKNNENRWKGVF